MLACRAQERLNTGALAQREQHRRHFDGFRPGAGDNENFGHDCVL
jgi:hypothetical protein